MKKVLNASSVILVQRLIGIKLRVFVVLLCVLLPGLAVAQEVRGRVFFDFNGNGLFDDGEKGLAGVPVTDGMGFVLTGSDGAYQITISHDPLLSAGGEPIISISWPSGKWPTTAWFKRLGEIKGNQRVDFGLANQKQSLPFTFVHGTDSHVPRSGKSKFINFREDIRQMADKLEFCFLTGDLIDRPDSHTFIQAKKEYDLFVEQTHDFDVPLFCTPGNHDVAGIYAGTWGAGDWDRKQPEVARLYGYGFYTQYVGPLRWSFNYAGVHFVGVDYMRLIDGQWRSGVPETAAKWLEEDLKLVKPGSRTLLFVHEPKGAGFSDVVRQYKVEQIFSGHKHIDKAFSFNTIPAVISGYLAGATEDRQAGYRIVQVNENGLDMFYRATGKPHSITIDYPRPGENFNPMHHSIQGAFYDPEGKIKKLTVKVGNHQEQVDFKRGPMWSQFNAKLNLCSAIEGVQTIAVVISDGEKTWRHRQRNIVIVEGDAILELDIGGIDVGGEIQLNGENFAVLKPTQLKGDDDYPLPVKGTEIISFTIPAEKLLRLNAIMVAAAEVLDSESQFFKRDRFCLLDVRIKYGGQVLRDPRFEYGPYNPTYIDDSTKYWIDIPVAK